MYWVPDADPAAQGEPEQQLERPEQPAGGGEHQPGAQQHDPCAGVARPAAVAASQSRHDLGEEARARRARLVDGHAAGVAVVADGRTR